MDSVKFFLTKRLKSYKKNFLLVQALAPKLGILEITTRNLAFKALVDNNKVDILSSFSGYFELDDLFVSKQTFGFWAKIIDEAKIHNDIVNLDKLDFKKYSKFNRKNKLLNYQKVKILYDLAVKIRNRAFHFENLYKLNDDQTPRISTRVGKTLVGIDPQMLEDFINDALFCFDEDLARYLE
ncbi:ATPase [Campylobacter concisus]